MVFWSKKVIMTVFELRVKRLLGPLSAGGVQVWWNKGANGKLE